MTAKPDPKKILNDAMQLDPVARALVAETLPESLDLDDDFAISEEWKEEILHRCAEIDRGEVELIDHATMISNMKERHGG